MLALTIGSLDEVRAELEPKLSGITQVTVITHGFQPFASDGDSLKRVAEAVYDRAGSTKTWLLDYDIVTGDIGNGALGNFGERGQGKFDPTDSRLTASTPTNVVLLWDWAPESNDPSAGWTGASADALFATMVDLGLARPATGRNNPFSYHFIAHSFGSAVTSEAVRRLAAFDVPVATDVVDREEIRAAAPQTVMEALRGQAGAYVQQTTPGQGIVILRGLKGSEVLHVVDGFRLKFMDSINWTRKGLLAWRSRSGNSRAA